MRNMGCVAERPAVSAQIWAGGKRRPRASTTHSSSISSGSSGWSAFRKAGKQLRSSERVAGWWGLGVARADPAGGLRQRSEFWCVAGMQSDWVNCASNYKSRKRKYIDRMEISRHEEGAMGSLSISISISELGRLLKGH